MEVKKSKISISQMVPARVVLTILGFFGVFVLQTSIVNLSVALVAMVEKPQPAAQSNETVNARPNLLPYRNLSKENELVKTGEFDCDIVTQGNVLGAFYYGYIFTPIPGGMLEKKYGAKLVYGFSVFTSTMLSVLIPTAARWSVWALVSVRVIQGLTAGMAFSPMNALIARWAPKTEISRISSFIYMGVQISIFCTNALSGMLCESSFLGGWPSIFYVTGFIGCIWLIFWIVLVYEYPEKHPRISEKELNYILEGQAPPPSGIINVPWKSICTSLPVWAVIVAHFEHGWISYSYVTTMPIYFANILHFDLKENGIVSGLPFLVMVIFSIPSCIAADVLRASGRLKITTIRKLFNSIAFYGFGLCVLAIAFVNCHQSIILALFALSFALNSFVFSGFFVTHVDMSPQFAGILFGITNCIATLPGFLAPAFVGAILSSGQTINNWRIIFITTACICFITGTFYNIFASAELQPWNKQLKTAKRENISLQTTHHSANKLKMDDF